MLRHLIGSAWCRRLVVAIGLLVLCATGNACEDGHATGKVSRNQHGELCLEFANRQRGGATEMIDLCYQPSDPMYVMIAEKAGELLAGEEKRIELFAEPDVAGSE